MCSYVPKVFHDFVGILADLLKQTLREKKRAEMKVYEYFSKNDIL